MAADGREKAAIAARDQLLRRERAAAEIVLREYEDLQKRLEKEIKELALQIAVAQSQGEASVSFLIERGRLKKVLDAVSKEMETIALRLARLTTGNQLAAIAIAQNQIEETAELSALRFDFDNEAVKKLAGYSALDSPLNVYFARLDSPLRRAMFQILTFGVATGKPSGEIATEIKRAIGSNSVNAIAIVRNETNRVYRESSREFYQSAGVKRWRWVAALDLTTCPVCWFFHGKIFKVETPFGSHVNCRCTMVVVLPNDQRAATGADRFEDLTGAQKLAILGAKRFALYKQGAPLGAFVKAQKSPFGTNRVLKNISEIEFKKSAKKVSAGKPKTATTTGAKR